VTPFDPDEQLAFLVVLEAEEPGHGPENGPDDAVHGEAAGFLSRRGASDAVGDEEEVARPPAREAVRVVHRERGLLDEHGFRKLGDQELVLIHLPDATLVAQAEVVWSLGRSHGSPRAGFPGPADVEDEESPPPYSEDRAENEPHEKEEEQELGNPRGRPVDIRKAEERGQQSHDEKYQSPAQHGSLLRHPGKIECEFLGIPTAALAPAAFKADVNGSIYDAGARTIR
jgi:hypothetical protein